jgi:hypothetical protein
LSSLAATLSRLRRSNLQGNRVKRFFVAFSATTEHCYDLLGVRHCRSFRPESYTKQQVGANIFLNLQLQREPRLADFIVGSGA